MKKLYILILSALFASFSASPIYAQGIPKEVKEWCLSVNEQNKDLKKKNHIKDSIIAVQDTINASKDRRLASHERDSVSWVRSDSAYRESSSRKDTIIATKDEVIQRRTTQRNVTWGGIILIVVLILL